MVIDEIEIKKEIESGKSYDLDSVLAKAQEGKGLTAIETSSLTQNLDSNSLEEALQIATKVKSTAKGDIASLYTCLYITNNCVNDCGYCGFRKSNAGLERITLSPDEIIDEARAIIDSGVTNAILIGGTIPEEQYKELIIDGTKSLRKLTLNPWIEFENLSHRALKEIQEAGADHFVLFQETYDRDRYTRLHSRNPLKRDYDARLRKVDEAIEAGFSNIGIGTLFGLNGDNVFEVLGLYHHARYLKDKGVGVCISVPTLKPAPGLSISPNRVSDEEIARIYTTLRLALPDTSLALSGREGINLRKRLFPIVDQIGSGGTPNPGGRTTHKEEYQRGDTQFKLYDTRSPKEVRRYLESTGIGLKHQVSWK
jgi:2-iminoacetate synthase